MMILQTVTFIAVGAVAGGLLGSTRSCPDGGCPLTATPKRGALWGGTLGLLMALSFGIAPQASQPSAQALDPNEPSALTDIRSEEEFAKTVLAAEGKAVVYFHAAWCGACKQFKPIINAVARDHADTNVFASVNTDRNRGIAEEYGVQYLPTTVVLENGREVKR
ncbi:MAG: thioredoxin family protein, partial [bacterium]|nr:thioredoxin family protein [bacterium]